MTQVHILLADDGCDVGEHVRIVAVYRSAEAAEQRRAALSEAVAADNRAKAEIMRRFSRAITAAGGYAHGQGRHPERIRLEGERDEELRRLMPPPGMDPDALHGTTYSVTTFDVIEAAAASQ